MKTARILLLMAAFVLLLLVAGFAADIYLPLPYHTKECPQ